MRVGYVVPRYTPHVGGVEVHAAEIASRLAPRLEMVEVLTPENGLRRAVVEEIDGVTVRRFPVPVSSEHYAFAPGLASYLARHRRRYDIVHAHSYHALPALAAALSNCSPLVFTPHYHGTGHSPFRRFLHRPYRVAGSRIFKRAERVICVSPAEAELVSRHFPTAAPRVVVIPNGVDVERFRTARPYRIDKNVVLSVGRLEPYKNVDRVLEALSLLGEDFVICVAGDGPAGPLLRRRAETLGLGDRVAFLGRIGDEGLRRWFRTATVYVTVSEQEAFGLTLAEALAAGARVVASDIPAHRDVLSLCEEPSATLVDPSAGAAELAIAIERRAGEARPEPVLDVPSWEDVAERTMDVYASVLQSARSPTLEEPEPSVLASAAAPPVGATKASRLSRFADAVRAHGPSILVWQGLLAATVLVTYAYSYAATHDAGKLHFHLFWAGALLFLVPAFLRLCSGRISTGERLSVITLVGLFSFVPKFLRSPDFPLFHDELAHWRQAEAIRSAGELFQPNPTIPIIKLFPGLHSLTASLGELAGISTFSAGLLLLAALHVIALLGVFMIAERLTRSARTAGIAAFIYALNPSFMFFDSQFAYESLGIVFFIWTVAAAVGIQTAETRRARVGWIGAAVPLAAACLATHHLSGYVMVVTLVLLGLFAVLPRRLAGGTIPAEGRLLSLVLLGIVGGLLGVSLSFVGGATESYLSPHVSAAVHQVTDLLGHKEHARQLFQGSGVPGYERMFAFMSPAIAALAALGGGLFLLRRRGSTPPAHRALALFGLLYFPAVPMILSTAGSEGARRSWGFTYLGLAVLVAPVVPALLSRGRVASRRPWRVGALALLAGLSTIVLIGNVTTGIDEEYRFPGPYVYGSDARSVTSELRDAADWVRSVEGPGAKIIGDRSTSLALAAFAKSDPAFASPGFPVWKLFFDVRPPLPVLKQLSDSRFRYLVIDRRMSRQRPKTGIYLQPREPRLASPPPASALDKYDYLPWANKVYASRHYEIYRLDFSALTLPPAPGAPVPRQRLELRGPLADAIVDAAEHPSPMSTRAGS